MEMQQDTKSWLEGHIWTIVIPDGEHGKSKPKEREGVFRRWGRDWLRPFSILFSFSIFPEGYP
jgi:hypothetical protein